MGKQGRLRQKQRREGERRLDRIVEKRLPRDVDRQLQAELEERWLQQPGQDQCGGDLGAARGAS